MTAITAFSTAALRLPVSLANSSKRVRAAEESNTIFKCIPPKQLARYKRLGAIQRYMKTLFRKPGWRNEIPKFEMEALNAMIKISDED